MSWPNPEIPSAPDSEPFLFNLDYSSFKAADTPPDCLHSFLFVCINFCLSNLDLNLYFGIHWLGLLILHLLANWEAYWTEFDLQCVCQTQTHAKSKHKRDQIPTSMCLSLRHQSFPDIIFNSSHNAWILMFSQLELTLDNVLQARMLRFCQQSP